MAAKKDFLGFIDPGRQIGRAPLVGMHFLHQPPVGAADGVGVGPRLQAKDLISFLFRHFAAARVSPPRCRVALRVFTPAGIPAVKIRQQ